MKDANFLKAHNARSLWHPMTAPSDSLKNPPAIAGTQNIMPRQKGMSGLPAGSSS